MVRVPLVVREGLPGGTRVTSIFSQKPGFTISSLRIGLCFWINKFSCSLVFLSYRNIMSFDALLANLRYASTGWWKVNKNKNLVRFINTKKAFKKLYMFYFETFRIILNPSSVKTQINTWQCQQFKTIRLCDARRDNAVTQKTSNANPRQPATSKLLKENAGPKVMQRILKQHLRKAINVGTREY